MCVPLPRHASLPFRSPEPDIYHAVCSFLGFPGGASGKEPACPCRRPRRRGFNPWVGKIPWRRAWTPTPVFLPGESHGQRSLVGCSPWGHRESEMTERLSMHTHTCSFLGRFLLYGFAFLSDSCCLDLRVFKLYTNNIIFCFACSSSSCSV